MTTISFIGAGNMARALVGGLIKAGHAPQDLRAADPFEQAREQMTVLGVSATENNATAVEGAGVIVLAVKPQVLDAVLRDMAPAINENTLILSIVAGIPIAAISSAIKNGLAAHSPNTLNSPSNQAIVRCMPNTPALLGLGMTGMYASSAVTADQRNQAETIASAAGRWAWLKQEDEIDAVTAVSGSGPAYFFYLMEAMIDAGVELGLPREMATELTVATATGAAAMADQAGADPAVLRQNVTSPGGTTERALGLFDEGRLNQQVRDALGGAAQRSAELAREFGR